MENETKNESSKPEKNEPVANTEDWEFNLVVENITEKQADGLLDLIIEWAEKNNTFCGGGCHTLKGE